MNNTVNILLNNRPADNAWTHNNIYRGKKLGEFTVGTDTDGTLLSDAQLSAIRNGTFTDLYLGDYFEITDNVTEFVYPTSDSTTGTRKMNGGNTFKLVFAGFDLDLGNGQTEITQHHAVFVPDESLYNMQMMSTYSGAYIANATGKYTYNTTAKGYSGSDAVVSHKILTKASYDAGITSLNDPNATFIEHTVDGQTTNIWEANLNPIYRMAVRLFGSSNLATFSYYQTTATSNWGWRTSNGVDLLTETEVYGTRVWGNQYGTYNKYKLPIFKFNPRFQLCRHRASIWLQDVNSATTFSILGGAGVPHYNGASNSNGARPRITVSPI